MSLSLLLGVAQGLAMPLTLLVVYVLTRKQGEPLIPAVGRKGTPGVYRGREANWRS